jgi:Arc/MetJ family transcription regulator
MRLHITLTDDVVAELDQRVGPRRRSGFVAAAVRAALQDERRWADLQASVGAVDDHGHEWDDDAAAWARGQRGSDERRSG